MVQQPVAFAVRFSKYPVEGLVIGQKMKYDDVVYNTGSGYSPTTGIFTAPSAGAYTFFVSVSICACDLLYAEN